MIGKTVSHYRILEKLGEGGMGVVYRAHDTKLDRDVALKFLPPELTRNANAKERFVREAQAASALDHPNICTIHEIDETKDGRTFIAMACYEGESLKERIDRGPLALDEALDIAVQIAQGLAKAHERKILHRDIKPANLLVTNDGLVKIVDFGIAKLAGAKLTSIGTTVGTARYMSPEQAKGEQVDQRTDIWSLGIVLYEMLTGKHAFPGEYEQATLYAIINEEPEPVTALRPDIPMELERIIGRCLEKDPGERYQTADDLSADLRHLRRTVGAENRSDQLAAVSPKPVGMLRWRYWAVPSLLLVAIIVMIIVGMPRREIKRRTKSIAVLPFKNMSDSKEDEYFSDGIAEDIRARLSKIADLKVISQQSVLRYKNSDKSIKDIGRELDVATVLEGSVRRAGNQVRIVAQLIDAGSEGHIWAETYDQEMTNIFSIQSDVAQKIASALEAKLTPAEKEVIEKRPTENLVAYDHYLRARDYYFRYNRQANENAIKLFKKALEYDPRYALAYAGLGDAYGQRVLKFGFPLQWADSSIVMSERALSIDPRLAEAFKSLALGYSCKGYLHKALEMQLMAIELNPEYVWGWANRGFFYYHLGQLDSALYCFRKSEAFPESHVWDYFGYGLVYDALCDTARAAEWYRRALDIQPDFSLAQVGLSFLYLSSSNYELAFEHAQEILRGDPENLSGLICAAEAKLFSGDYPEAGRYYEKAHELSSIRILEYQSRSITTGLGYVLWKSGKTDEARALFHEGMRENNELLRQGSELYKFGYDNASISAIQGNRDDAYQWLQRAIDAGWLYYRIGLVDPLFENIRNEEKYRLLMDRVKAKVDEQRRLVMEMEKQ